MNRFETHLGINYTPEYICSLSDEELAAKIRDCSDADTDLERDLIFRASIWDLSIEDAFDALEAREAEGEDTTDDYIDLLFHAAEVLHVKISEEA